MEKINLGRRALLFTLGLAVSVSLTLPVIAQEGWSAKVLATRDTDEKEYLVCRSSKEGVAASDLTKLIARERHGPAVASAAGQYFERGTLGKETPDVLRLVAKRPDIGAQALAYASLSPKAVDLIVGFAKSGSKGDQQIAARMLAATAMMRSEEDRASKRLSGKAVGSEGKKMNVIYKTEIETLLGSTKDAVTLEYLLLAVGLDRLNAVKEQITPHADSREASVAMAAQFALAATKQPVDEAALLKAIARAPKRAKPQPAFSYDPRQSPRLYAIRAAGEAKLTSAIKPLMQLLKDEDLHTAVYAARALGQIGGEGLAVQVIKAMDDDMPWPVRIAMYDVAGVNPDKQAIALLRQRFDDETGRLRQDALYALLSIVAGKPNGLDIISFDEWWSINSDTFEVDPEATIAWRGTTKVGKVEVDSIAGFYESGVISDRPVFTVDTSASMKGAQIESLKETLTEVVLAFPERVKFNIVDFGGYVRTLAPGGLIPAKNRKQAMREFTYDLELTLGTRSYDAVERAMELPEMDTIHFLSDGAPVRGHVNSWSRITYVTRLYCSTAPVAVHVIYFPEQRGKAQGKASMRNYAEVNAGQFFVVVAPAKN